MESTTKLTLNLQLPNCAVTMYAVQNDRLSRKVQATLLDGDTAWTPPAGSEAVVRFVKPDGTMGFYDVDEDDNAAVTWTGNVATIRLAEQVLTCAGDVFCQVNFYTASEERLSTFSWLIKVQQCVITDETIESTDYFNILSQQIAAILDVIATMPTPATATPLMDGTAAVGTSIKYAREDHVHPTDTSRAPTSHASSATTYGKGTGSNYGHLKLSDSTSSSSSTSDGIAATPKAVYSMGLTRAPINHASTTNGYGVGTDTNYGHVKLTDSLTDTTTAATGGLALSAKAGSDLKGAITSLQTGKQDSITILSSEPSNTTCASLTNTTLASFNLTAGTWIIIGFHDWTANVNATYIDNIIDATNNSTRATLRNNSQLNGGGASLTAFVKLTASATINYVTYNGDSETRTARNIRAIAFKIA